MAKPFRWDIGKNLLLKLTRRVSFEDVIASVRDNNVLATIEHPNRIRFPRQKIMIVRIGGYAYMVPFVETDDEIFLKTIIPSRKATRDLLLRNPNEP